MDKVGAKNRIRRNRILRALLETGGSSLTRLTRLTGMSLPMVSNVVRALEKERYVVKKREGTSERVGRPPIMARLNGQAGFVMGIDMGRLNTNIVLLNLEQAVVQEIHHRSLPLGNDLSLVEDLYSEIRRVIAEARIHPGKLLGIGISIPGIVRGREGVSTTYLNFGKTPLRDLLQERWKKPVVIEHDAKAMALGERWFGAARNVTNALCLNIGWGLGLGIILDGRIYYGRNGYAGEFGHIRTVPEGGKLCQCGKTGCLETVASGRAIAERARERLAAGSVSKLQELVRSPEKIDAELVVKAAVLGDQFSIEILEEAGRYLGEGIAKLINLFNPELVILGGRVSGAKQFILDPVRSAAARQSLVQLIDGVQFTISELGSKSGALGVAWLAARDLFEVEHLNPSAFV